MYLFYSWAYFWPTIANSASSDGYLNGLRMAWEIINCPYEDEKRKLRTIFFLKSKA